MQLINYTKAQMPIFALLAIVFVFTSCGTYQHVDQDNDGIYGSTKNTTEQTNHVTQDNNNTSYYKNYFQEKSTEYDYVTEENAVFTDVDSYEGKYVEQDTTEQKSYPGWGQDNEDVTINVYGGGFYNNGYINSWRWQNRFYGYDWRFGGWGYGGFYDPFWCSPYYGGYYGYGYGYGGYYNSPYWNNYGYYNNYRRNGVAYHNSRRGSSLYRANNIINGRRNSNTISRGNTTRPRVSSSTRPRTNTTTPRPRVNNSVKPRPRTNTTTPRPRTNNNVTPKPRVKPTVKPRRSSSPRPRTNTSSPRPRNNSYSSPRSSRSSSPSRSSTSSRGRR